MISAIVTFFVFVAVYLGIGLLLTSRMSDSVNRIPQAITLSFWLCFAPTLVLSRTHLITPLSAKILILFLFVLLLIQRRKNLCLNTINIFAYRWPITACSFIALFHFLELSHGTFVRGGFFYLSEIKYIVESQGLPAVVTHFGQHISPQVDKLGFSHVGALISSAAGSDYLMLGWVGYLVTVLLAGLSAYYFFCCFVAPPLAACAAVFTFTNIFTAYVTTTRSFYLPENTSLIYLFSGAALFFHCLDTATSAKRTPEARLILLSGATGAAGAACLVNHLEIGFLFFIVISSSAIAFTIIKRSLSPLLALGLTCAVTSGFLAASYALLGRLPEFLTEVGSPKHYAAFKGYDPTYEFLAPLGRHTNFSEVPIPHQIQDLIIQGLRLQGQLFHSVLGIIIVIATLILIVAVFFIARKEFRTSHRYIVGTAICFLSVLFIWTSVIVSDRFFNIWVYQTEILRRVVPYCSIFLTLSIFIAGDFLLKSIQLSRCRKLVYPTCWAMALSLYMIGAPFKHPLPNPFLLSAQGVAALNNLSTRDSVKVLASEISTGAFHVLAGTPALLEGHQPVLRPEMLIQTLTLMEQAREFFRQPTEHEEFLTDNQITHVIITRSSRGEFGGAPLLRPNEIAVSFNELPFLCNGRIYGAVEVFEVCATG